MSCVAVRIYEDRIEIASDSCIMQGDTIINSSFKKLQAFEFPGHDDIIIGSCGTVEVIDALFKYFRNNIQNIKSNSDLSDFLEEFSEKTKMISSLSENDFIIIIDKKVYYIFGCSVVPIYDYRAIGSGLPYALTALTLGHSPIEAIQVACKLSPYVTEPIISYTVRLNNDENN